MHWAMKRKKAVLVTIGLSILAAGLISSSSAAEKNDSLCTEHGLQPRFSKKGFPAEWGKAFSVWGRANIEHVRDAASGKDIARVWFPAGTYDPGSMLSMSKQVGGTGFAVILDDSGYQCATLKYRVRFPPGFNFVRGGKLPGLAGGLNISYPKLPRGENGFTARLMWREHGQGEVYAYLRTTPKPGLYYGTSIGRGSWQFSTNKWVVIEQSIFINHPDRHDGMLRLSVDGNVVIDKGALQFRDKSNIHIDGLIFETFFGGNDETWATPERVHVDFADFSLVGYAPGN